MSRTLTVHSDGTARGTIVLDENGNKLEGIGELSFNISAFGVAELTLTINKAVSVNVQAEATLVNFVCPVCSESIDHQCDTTLGVT